MKKITLYKNKNFNELLNDCTEFIKQSFVIYSKAFLYIMVPPLLVVMAIDVYMYDHMANEFSRYTAGGIPDSILKVLGTATKGTIVPQLLSGILAMVQAALVFNYVLLYERAEDPSQITVADIWAQIKESFGRVLWSYVVLALIIISVGTIAVLLVAGAIAMSGALAVLVGMALFCFFIYFTVPYSFFIMIRVKENVSPGEALSRCSYLIKGKWWLTFGVLTVAGLVVYSCAMMCIMPLSVINGIGQIHRITQHRAGSPLDFGPLYGITQALTQGLTLYFSALVSMCVAVIYYSLSEDKDNIGLLDEINNIGSKPDEVKPEEGEY